MGHRLGTVVNLLALLWSAQGSTKFGTLPQRSDNEVFTCFDFALFRRIYLPDQQLLGRSFIESNNFGINVLPILQKEQGDSRL